MELPKRDMTVQNGPNADGQVYSIARYMVGGPQSLFATIQGTTR